MRQLMLQLLQPLTDRGPSLPVFLGEAQAEGPVGEAELKGLDRLLAPEPAFFEVRERCRRLHESLVVVVDHLGQQRLVVRVVLDRRRQLRDGRLLCRSRGRNKRRRSSTAQDLDRVPERQPVVPHNKVDHRPARPTPETVEEVLCRRHDKRRRRVLVERAFAGQVPAPVRAQFDPLRPDQGR